MSIVSSNIKYLRKLNGLTQEQFAQKIEIKRSLLGAYEEARANPNLTNLENMAAAFGISVDNLLKNDFKKLREKPELRLSINSARPMTVSHSGAVSSRRASVTETQSAVNTTEIETRQHIPQRVESTKEEVAAAVPTTVSPQEARLVHEKQPTQPLPSTQTAQVPIFNNHFTPKEVENIKPAPYPTIQWVSKSQENHYEEHCQNPAYLVNLPSFQLPNLPSGYYRGFESGADFPFQGAILVGNFVRNWYEIKTDISYIFVLRNQGYIYRKVSQNVNGSGFLTLKSDIGTIQPMEISLPDVLEVWEVKAFVSHQLPTPTASIERMENLVAEMQKEIERIR